MLRPSLTRLKYRLGERYADWPCAYAQSFFTPSQPNQTPAASSATPMIPHLPDKLLYITKTTPNKNPPSDELVHFGSNSQYG